MGNSYVHNIYPLLKVSRFRKFFLIINIHIKLRESEWRYFVEESHLCFHGAIFTSPEKITQFQIK